MRNQEYKHINFIQEKIIPDAHKKHYGSYMSFNDQELSPGCMACKTVGRNVAANRRSSRSCPKQNSLQASVGAHIRHKDDAPPYVFLRTV